MQNKYFKFKYRGQSTRLYRIIIFFRFTQIPVHSRVGAENLGTQCCDILLTLRHHSLLSAKFSWRCVAELNAALENIEYFVPRSGDQTHMI